MNDVAPAPPRRPLRWLLPLIAIAALGAAGWFGWHSWQTRQQQANLARDNAVQQLAAMQQGLEALRRDQRANARSIQDAAATNRILRDEVLGLGQRSALLEQNLAQLADSSRQGAQAVHREEAELLLNQAQQRLVFAGDLDGARRLYGLAANALDSIDSPDYLNLRQALIQERNALDALGPGVRARTAAQLDQWAGQLEQLPEHLPTAADTAQPWWQQLLSPLVQIRPADGKVLIARSERIAANDSLQIELSLARAALERADDKAWQQALDRCGTWLQRLWPDSPQRQQRRAELQQLRSVELRPNLPELGSTLQQLRSMRAAEDAP
ncbi:uroporphyrinogen-III C-methyltransferase [Stenotrophomonas terrae]|uniref:uroporphyrinogen-III C-methyltransferase n=1 Tax=Stenotrophomonas terrae TaxID=405446 RepID=UPI00320B7080